MDHRNHASASNAESTDESTSTINRLSTMKIALNYGGENSPDPNNTFQSCCTQLRGNSFGGRSCGKIVLVDVFSDANPEHLVCAYEIIDDQSNSSQLRHVTELE